MAVQTKRVIIPEDMGSTVEFGGKETDKWNVNHDDTLTVKNGKLSVVPQQSGGLDCAAVGNLPKKPWAKGTTILARGADGACHQLTALDSIFQEVGVGIAANKLSGLTGEKYHVVVTVSNTGEGTNERTDLVIVRPQLGNYTANNFTKTASTGATIERTDDWNYVIKNLRKGGTARVEFDVTPNAAGTFQFSSSVNPNSALDQQSNNNRATITLSASTPQSAVEVTQDCPLVSATYNNSPLMICGGAEYNNPVEAFTISRRGNILTDLTTLSGVSIKLTGVGSVLLTDITADDRENYDTNYGYVVGYTHEAVATSSFIPRSGLTKLLRVGDYTYNATTGILTITKDVRAAMIALKPRSPSCNTQFMTLAATREINTGYTISSTVPANNIVKTSTYSTPGYSGRSLMTPGAPRALDTLFIGSKAVTHYTYGGFRGGRLQRTESAVITVPKDGRTYTVTTTSPVLPNVNQQGNLSVTGGGISISIRATAQASSSDSIVVGPVTIKAV